MSDGGLAVALAESAMGGRCGCDIDISTIPGAADLDDIRTLFAESPSRFVVSVKKENAAEFEKLMAGTYFAKAGETNSTDKVVFKNKENTVISMTCAEIASAWKREI